jgi:predicted PurR-regulated permease PerM
MYPVALSPAHSYSRHTHWVVVLAFLILWRGIQDYVTSPYLMGRGLQLHPLAVIFGVLVGGEVAGVVGLFLSVPVMASLRIIWKAWRLQQGGKSAAPNPEVLKSNPEAQTNSEATQQPR